MSILSLRAAVMPFLRSIPWYVFAIAGALAWGLFARADARHWRKVAENRGEALASVKAAQVAANVAAKANVLRIESAQAATSERIENVYKSEVRDIGDQYRAYRLRHARNPRNAVTCNLSDIPTSATVSDGTGQPGDIVVAAPLGLLEEGDGYRLQVQGWQDWYRGQRDANK